MTLSASYKNGEQKNKKQLSESSWCQSDGWIKAGYRTGITNFL